MDTHLHKSRTEHSSSAPPVRPPQTRSLRLRDGRVVQVRALEPRDRQGLAAAVERLSPESRYLRFATPKRWMTDRELDFLLDVDHHHREALLAVDPSTGDAVAVVRYVEVPGEPSVAEIAATVADDWQGVGLGRALLGQLTARAREEGYSTLRANVLADNKRAIAMLLRAGFVRRPGLGVLREFELAAAREPGIATRNAGPSPKPVPTPPAVPPAQISPEQERESREMPTRTASGAQRSQSKFFHRRPPRGHRG